MSQRTDQIEATLVRAVQEVLARGLNDPRVRGLITVTGADVSPDLGDATVRVSVLPAEHADLTLHGLRSAQQHVRTEVGKRVRMRRMPRLSFKLDASLKNEARVLNAIAEARRADAERQRPNGSEASEDHES